MAVDTKNLTGSQRDAFLFLQNLFNTYGLGTLAPKIYDYIVQGYSSDTIAILLQQTPEWTKRFAGNDARVKAGLPALSPAEYLSMETGYRQVFAQAGLPSGFYDDPADFAKYIANDTSVAEISSRVNDAVKAAQRTDPGYRQMLSDQFGIGLTDGDIASYFLDQKRALPILERNLNAMGIADAARRNGLDYSADRAGQLAEAGLTGEQAAQGYGQVAELTQVENRAASAYGLDYGQLDAEDEAFLGLASAKRKRQTVEQTFNAYNPQRQGSAVKGALSGDTSSSY